MCVENSSVGPTIWRCTAFFFIASSIFGSFVDGRESTRAHPLRASNTDRGDQPPPSDDDYSEGDILDVHPLAEVFNVRQTFGYGNNQGYSPAKLHPCEQSSCYPATGNLLIGRESQLYASSTCGLHGQERYCIVSHLQDRKKCFWCDSRPTTKPNPQLNHNISNIVYRLYPGTRQKSWWQSENGKENVYIQLDLEAEFHFTHLIITFKTFRPAAMLIERSYDFGKTWQVYRYFAQNCQESFGIASKYPVNLTDVVCESRYSNVAPSTDGEIIYRVLPPTLHIDNPYSTEVQNLLKMTNLRINFTKLHTLGDDLLDKRGDLQEKYYYAITDMVVRGSCSCYGHANRCLPLPGIDPKPDMVHGRCECTHNTKGRNCEKCEDFFNDLPWRPAIGKQTNACKRCNCNNHATSCHFDPALYEATGRVSGGVCVGCQHNTIGPNCDQCSNFYYKDPERDIQDPEVCRPCDCDPDGSLDGGICDSVTDEANNLVAGRCHCKKNVEGRRCDTCKNGFWNFTNANPDGCQSCTCNTLGTIDNQGCNMRTGECFCKRYVTGRDCNQCLPEFWGLSEKKDGCQFCDCDRGGSVDNNCDVITGQCQCREHMTGRRCDTPKQQYFTASLDFLLYEAELARASPNCQVVIREPYRDGRPNTWTGTGVLKTFENAYFEFSTNNIEKTSKYEIEIRYEPTLPQTWEDAQITVSRPGPADPNGPCANSPEVETRKVVLEPNSRRFLASPPVCFEAGVTYKINMDFRRFDSRKESPTASVLIDSVVLLPSIDYIPWFATNTTEGLKNYQEYERNNCNEPQYQRNPEEAPEICQNMYNSIAAYIFNGAFNCQCDPEGSESKFCKKSGGYCTCKPNVVGRRCDRCAPGTYGFGPDGCKACDCNSIGALDNFCNTTTGQCKCRANTYGRECNRCRNGFWNFPNCVRCDCNGHSDTCDPLTGACEECKDNTEGHTCDRCKIGFYGDPRLNVDIPCRPCPCPGLGNHSFASSCSLDPYTKDVICDCQKEYSGSRCDICADNYYGNPEVPGGKCQKCDCSDKIDELKQGNCDPHTGKCLQCLYDTTGDHCEVCRPGYFRYSEDEMCEECVCHALGTNRTAGPCDPNTGQCPCLPHVTGLHCNECIENYWRIASGEGCSSCDCDPSGSVQAQCNEYDGQCECKPGFGGRQCNECMAQFWGDPKVECKECHCNNQGSKTLQCDMRTGDCKCLPGIGGTKCDTCARGYLGNSPKCYPCGECFDNWDRILDDMKNNTIDLIKKAGLIKKVGARGAYTKEFDDMQNQLDDIEDLLNNSDDVDVEAINEELSSLRKKLNITEQEKLKDLDETLANTKENVLLTEIKINNLKDRIDQLNNKIKELQNNGTQLQEHNVQGALSLIQAAKAKADEAVQNAENTQKTISESERQCKSAENFLNTTKDTYKTLLDENSLKIETIANNSRELSRVLPDLNELVCDGRGDPCDSICGGAGCSSCGNSISCEDGAKQQAETALSLANSSEIALRTKEGIINNFIRNVSQINTNEGKKLAEDAYQEAEKLFKKYNSTGVNANDLKNKIDTFLKKNITDPEVVKEHAKKVLEKKIDVSTPETIKKLANDIKKKVDSLTNTEAIIQATREDLIIVNKLKDAAADARMKAGNLSSDANTVKKALENSTLAQENAGKAIDKALNNTAEVNKLLTQIKEKTMSAEGTTNSTAETIKKLGEKLNDLQQNITNNGIYANRVKNETATILSKAEKAYEDFNSLHSKYETARHKLSTNINNVNSLKEKADLLFQKVVSLLAHITKTEEAITKLEASSQQDPSSMENQLAMLIKKANNSTAEIEKRIKYYKNCN
ncbi:laminin subunit beta-1 isoform X1 [Coccinella septempunctata]|uniref:laminin subunit beta-1 isoform X1 n=1 Tax=Coccinella septempunctata TaxID=41139 RepID=UPI001D08AF73|nr:laminin subunit beta-1 isoform X1 [Coccinella septempunctata]XP_044764892.1 laminin subunit beta-1 isoform X1 [Coccinella septempunctata]